MMSQPSQLHKVNKERTDIEPAAKLLATYRDNARQLEEAAQILADPTAGAELHKMATEESATLERQQREIEQQAQELLIPKDPRDEKSLLLEIRAGTGGDEAALFAGELFRMYSKYAEIKGFKVDMVEATETTGRRLQGGRCADRRQGRVQPLQIRSRGPPGTACSRH